MSTNIDRSPAAKVMDDAIEGRSPNRNAPPVRPKPDGGEQWIQGSGSQTWASIAHSRACNGSCGSGTAPLSPPTYAKAPRSDHLLNPISFHPAPCSNSPCQGGSSRSSSFEPLIDHLDSPLAGVLGL